MLNINLISKIWVLKYGYNLNIPPNRQLYHPDYERSQGEVSLWLEMFDQNEDIKQTNFANPCTNLSYEKKVKKKIIDIWNLFKFSLFFSSSSDDNRLLYICSKKERVI